MDMFRIVAPLQIVNSWYLSARNVADDVLLCQSGEHLMEGCSLYAAVVSYQ